MFCLFQIEITILPQFWTDNKQKACSLLEILTKCQLLQSSLYVFIYFIYFKICTSSVDNIIFIMILTQQQKLSDSVQYTDSELNMQD